MPEDDSRLLDAHELEILTATLHRLAFPPEQQTNSEGIALPQLADAPRLAAPITKPAASQQRPQMPAQPVIPTWSEAQKLAGGRGIGGKVVKILVVAAILAGGFLGVRALMSSDEGVPKDGSKEIPVLDTTGGTGTVVVNATYALPNPNLVEITPLFQTVHCSNCV